MIIPLGLIMFTSQPGCVMLKFERLFHSDGRFSMELSDLTILIIIPILILPALYVAWQARRRGRNPYAWGLFGLINVILATIALVLLPRVDPDAGSNHAPADTSAVGISDTNRLLEFLRVRDMLRFWLLNLVVVLFAVFLISAFLSSDDADLVLELSLIYLTICPIFWLRTRLKGSAFSIRGFVGRLPDDRKWARWMLTTLGTILFSVGAIFLVWYPISIISPEIVDSVFSDDGIALDGSLSSATLFVANIVALVLVAPIFEELIFRGFIFQRWAHKWGGRKGAILAALLFAVLHFDILGAFFFGLVMSILYIKTRTLLVPMLAHAINNASAVIAQMLPDSPTPVETSIADFQAAAIYGIGLFCLILPWAVYFIVKNRDPGEMPPLNAN